jgi:hypothetical protein
MKLPQEAAALVKAIDRNELLKEAENKREDILSA